MAHALYVSRIGDPTPHAPNVRSGPPDVPPAKIARRRIARSGAIHPDRPLWTPKEDKLLGTDSDQKIGKKLGRPVVAVLKRRHAKGIPNPAPRRKLWRPEEIKLLGTRPDKEIAARLGCPVRTVVTKRFNQGIRAFF
jgi:hypothetical protein